MTTALKAEILKLWYCLTVFSTVNDLTYTEAYLTKVVNCVFIWIIKGLIDKMAEKHDLIAQLLNKGGDVEQCLKLLKEVRESEEKVAEREERRAERELERAKIEKEIRLKELEIKEKEVSLGTNSLAEMSKTKPKVQLPKFSEGEDIEVFLTSFGKLAISYKWVKSEWAIRLVPQLIGKHQIGED